MANFVSPFEKWVAKGVVSDSHGTISQANCFQGLSPKFLINYSSRINVVLIDKTNNVQRFFPGFSLIKFINAIFVSQDLTLKTAGGGGAHWCDSLIIGENLEILYTDCASFPGFVCCVFCSKKLAEIHAMTISRKNSSKECTKLSQIYF